MISAATLPHRRSLAFYGASAEDDAPPSISTGEALLSESHRLRLASADAYRNDPLISNALKIIRRGLVSNPYPVSENPKATKAIARWGRECGHKHSYGSFAAIQRMVAQHLLQDGECFAQRVWTSSKHSANGLLIAVWPKRLIDKTRGHNFTGHEYDDGLWSGTWFQSNAIEPGFQAYAPIFVPRDSLAWIRYVVEGDQVDGAPRFHAAIESALQLSDWSQTALVQQRVSACLAAIGIARDSIFGPRMDLGPRITDADGNPFNELQPGTLAIAQGIDDIKSVVPSTNGSFSVERHEGRVSAGTGLTRELVAGDMSSSSFSAARHALLVRDEVTDDAAIDFDVLRERVIDWWLEAELAVGRDWGDVEFEHLARPMPSIDPVKTAKADEIDIKVGVKSRRQAIAERGRDPERVLAEVRKEREEFGHNGAE